MISAGKPLKRRLADPRKRNRTRLSLSIGRRLAEAQPGTRITRCNPKSGRRPAGLALAIRGAP
jgi:hypothetical protein